MVTYEVILHKQGKVHFVQETLLDGLFNTELILHTRTDFIESLGLCEFCYGCIAHIIIDDIDPDGYTNQFCPIFFFDVIKPTWKLQQVEGFYTNHKASLKLYRRGL